MANVTFSAWPVVWIRVRGERISEHPYSGFDDGDLVGDLLRFMREQQIYPARTGGGVCGGGMYDAAFAAEDAERVVAWLKARGATQT